VTMSGDVGIFLGKIGFSSRKGCHTSLGIQQIKPQVYPKHTVLNRANTVCF
jgi:hypothetical protein